MSASGAGRSTPVAEPVDLAGPAVTRDPYPTYARLRESGPVHRVRFPSGVEGWLVTGYDAARATLADPRLGKSHALGGARWRRLAAIMPEPQHTRLQGHLLHLDAPRHTVLRRLVAGALGRPAAEALRPRVEAHAHALLDCLAADGTVRSGSADLVAGFAAPLALAVLGDAIGLSPAQRAAFRPEWCSVVRPVGPRSPDRATYVARLAAVEDYVDGLVTAKRAQAADDLLGRLVRARDDGRLTDSELTSSVFQLLVAGQEPVSAQIGNALLALLLHPDQADQLRREPARIPGAVEELLRYDGAFELTTWRFLAEDAPLHGVEVPAGESVIVSLAAADRDPRRFPDADTLDVTRPAAGHLAFGHGVHHCAGAALGRVELQVALEAVLARLPEVRLAVPPEELSWVPSAIGRGLSALPVTVRPREEEP